MWAGLIPGKCKGEGTKCGSDGAGVNSLLWEEQIRSEQVPFGRFLLWPEQHPWHSVLADFTCSGLVYWVGSRAVHSE